MKEEAKKNVSAPALYGFLASPYLVLLEADFIKKAVDYSFFLVIASQKDGRVRFESSSIGWIYMLRGVRRGVAQSGQRICFGYRGP